MYNWEQVKEMIAESKSCNEETKDEENGAGEDKNQGDEEIKTKQPNVIATPTSYG